MPTSSGSARPIWCWYGTGPARKWSDLGTHMRQERMVSMKSRVRSSMCSTRTEQHHKRQERWWSYCLILLVSLDKHCGRGNCAPWGAHYWNGSDLEEWTWENHVLRMGSYQWMCGGMKMVVDCCWRDLGSNTANGQWTEVLVCRHSLHILFKIQPISPASNSDNRRAKIDIVFQCVSQSAHFVSSRMWCARSTYHSI